MWGGLDLCSVGWYLTSKLLHGQIPIYSDIVKAIGTSASFGIPSLEMLTGFSLLLYASLVLSGIFLIRQKRIGAIISYIQTPFRIAAIIPPSIFFATWPLKYIISSPRAIESICVFAGLVLLSETVKTVSIVMWQSNSSATATSATKVKPS